MDPQNMQNSSGMMNGMPPQPKHDRKIGPVVGAVVIILALILAALYFFGQRVSTPAPIEENSQTVQETTLPASAASSDDIASLEAELQAELKDIDYSF